MSYWHREYLRFWAAYKRTFSNEVAKGDYDFPGRLDADDVWQFGIELYYK